MGYFSNGTEGEGYQEEYCLKCVHFETCPILVLHLIWNYDANKDQTKKTALDMFIPRDAKGYNLKCLMFHEGKSEEVPNHRYEQNKLKAWNAGLPIKSNV